MAKISSTGKQFTITVPKELMKMMGWDERTEVIISKYPGKDILFIENIKKK
ncbi:hypothetical protein J4234_01865 [Candidatus Woesearchaeota archaeon]|nr:hypothetical protein [Candidatus Woesearchaeota archaeon]